MKKRLLGTKLLSAVLAAAVTMSGLPVAALAEEAVAKSEDGLIASFNFDSEENGFSGAGAKAVVNGTAVLENSYDGAGKALAVSDSNWLSVYTEDDGALLKGVEEFTLSYDSKATNQKNGWTFYAAPNLDAQVGNGYQEHYIGIMDKASGITVERFHNNGVRPPSVTGASSENWKHVDVVVTETTTYLYVDGELAGSETSAHKVSDILGETGGIIQIGKANWGSGEYYEGLIDNVKIYSRAKDAEEIAQDAPEIMQDEDAENTTPFASYAFNGNTEDGSGNGYNGTLTGTAGYETDGRGGIVFPTGEEGQTGVNYVQLDEGILDNLQDAGELTVTAWVRNDVTSTNSNIRGSVFSFGSDEENQFSFATQNWGKARATFLINGVEQGGTFDHNDNTSLIYNTPGNVDSPLGEWYQIAITLRDVSEGGSSATRIKYYMNGELLCNLVTPAAVSDLGDLTYAYIGTGNTKDFYRDFQGGVRKVEFIGEVLSPKQIASKYEMEEQSFAKTDAEIVAEVEKNLTIPNADDIRGNITLPSEIDGASITWESSNESVVNTEERANDGYDSTPAGVVTRGDQDVSVKVTATISKGAVEPVQKVFDLTVKAASGITEEDYDAYLFAYFIGEGSSMGEQIYFATSQDGLNWTAMNEGDPVATSSLGEKGLRDPFIIRSPEGDKFYMIATDLKINQGNGWGAAQSAGSQSIMVWESTDLVNWSDQRMVKVAREDAGCTWAPEAFYDEKTGEYIVFWASKTSEDNYGVQKVYYAKTRDFYTFTEPEVWIELYKSTNGTPLSIIDTSVISVMENGKKVYYRFSKNEASEDHDTDGGQGKYTIMEKSDSLLGEWTQVTALKDHRWVEGGTCFKFNGEDKWCLLLDDFGGKGYYPLVTTDLGSAQFTELDSNQYSFPSTMRHGTVLSLTQEEYDAVMAKWNRDVRENTEPEQEDAVLSYDFEEQQEKGVIKDASGSGRDGKMFGNATYVEDEERGGQVLYLDGITGTYASLPEGFFEGRNSFTVSMDVKAESVSGNFFTFGIGKSDGRYIFLRTEDTSSRLSMTKGSYGSEQTAAGTTESIKGRWVNYTMVVSPDKIALYADGVLLGSQDVTVKMTDLGINLLSYLGRSFYAADGYFKGYFDNVEVFNRAMDAEEIADRNDGIETYTVTYQAGEGGRIEGTAVQKVDEGESTQEVTAVAEEGYVFTGWNDGKKEAVRSDSNVTEDVTYTAQFEKKQEPSVENVTVEYVAGEGGSIAGTTTQVIEKGGDTTQVTAVALAGYTFSKWSDGVTTASRSDKNVTASMKVTAIFTKDATDEGQTPGEQPDDQQPAASRVKLNEKKLTMGVKEKVTLKATVLPAGASQKVTWSSSNQKVAVVNQKGKITAKRRGKTVITAATANGKKITCKVTVKKAPKKLNLKTTAKTLKVGKSFKIKARLGKQFGSYKLTFKSNKPKVASVSANGKVKAKKKGTAVITVRTYNKKKATIRIKVR